MNAVELLLFLLAIYGSVVLARIFYPYIGWWGVISAGILSFVAVYLLSIAAFRLLGRSHTGNRSDRPEG